MVVLLELPSCLSEMSWMSQSRLSHLEFASELAESSRTVRVPEGVRTGGGAGLALPTTLVTGSSAGTAVAVAAPR